jgi:hypothetical protein
MNNGVANFCWMGGGFALVYYFGLMGGGFLAGNPILLYSGIGGLVLGLIVEAATGGQKSV